jgi:hypothetical protein
VKLTIQKTILTTLDKNKCAKKEKNHLFETYKRPVLCYGTENLNDAKY